MHQRGVALGLTSVCFADSKVLRESLRFARLSGVPALIVYPPVMIRPAKPQKSALPHARPPGVEEGVKTSQ